MATLGAPSMTSRPLLVLKLVLVFVLLEDLRLSVLPRKEKHFLSLISEGSRMQPPAGQLSREDHSSAGGAVVFSQGGAVPPSAEPCPTLPSCPLAEDGGLLTCHLH